MYVTNEELLQRVSAGLQRLDIESNSPYHDIVADANEWAYNEIRSRLIYRGFSQAQIDAWGRRAEFNLALGLYWSFVLGGVSEQLPEGYLSKLDRRDELDEVFVLLGTPPAQVLIGQVTAGNAVDVNEVQSVRVLYATSGYFTLTFEGQTTTALAYNVNAATLEAALETLSNITNVSVTGTGTSLDPFLITFLDSFANRSLMTTGVA